MQSVCVCVCVCVSQDVLGKDKLSRDSRVFLPGLCLLQGDSQRLHRVVILFPYGLVCAPIPRGVRAMSFYEVHFFRNSDPLLPPDSKAVAPENGSCQACPNEWITSRRPRARARPRWPRANFWAAAGSRHPKFGVCCGHPVSGWVRPAEVRAPRAAWEEVWVAVVRRAAPLA